MLSYYSAIKLFLYISFLLLFYVEFLEGLFYRSEILVIEISNDYEFNLLEFYLLFEGWIFLSIVSYYSKKCFKIGTIFFLINCIIVDGFE